LSKTVASFERDDSLFIERCLRDYKKLLHIMDGNKMISDKIEGILEIIKKADESNTEELPSEDLKLGENDVHE